VRHTLQGDTVQYTSREVRVIVTRRDHVFAASTSGGVLAILLATACGGPSTDSSSAVVVDPPATLPVDTTPLFTDDRCTAHTY
jgi:hypothetical protein